MFPFIVKLDKVKLEVQDGAPVPPETKTCPEVPAELIAKAEEVE
jgi:hypothetical protein